MTDDQKLPIGTEVIAYPGVRPEDSPTVKRLRTRTRSKPWIVGGQLVVAVEGYAGGIALTHIDVVDR